MLDAIYHCQFMFRFIHTHVNKGHEENVDDG
jgi:hypothetical protein